MERLFTPWRSAYVTAEDRPLTCFLCQKPAEKRDEENLILYRGATSFALMNLFPYNNGHLMVAPYEHTGDLTSLSPAVASELMALLQRSVRVLTEAYHPQGFNA